jgi:hypothetical protein
MILLGLSDRKFNFFQDYFNLNSSMFGIVFLQLLQVLNGYQYFLRAEADVQNLVWLTLNILLNVYFIFWNHDLF